MCNPIVGVGLALVQGMVGHQAAMQDYNAQSQAWRQNYVNALAAGRDEQNQLLLRSMQEEDAKNQKVEVLNIEEAQRRAEAEVSAAEGGVSGISISNVLQDIGRRAAFNRQTEERNFEMTAAQLTQEMNATNTRIMGRINSVQRPVKPNALGFLLPAIGAGLRMLPT
jgi:hypothetical protein